MRSGVRSAAAFGVLLGSFFTFGSRGAVGQSAWVDQDIGAPAIAGTATLNAGTFTISAAGAGIGGRADQFHFVYQAVIGDVDIRARVDSLTQADPWSKAGVMIRGSLSADAAHGLALVSAARGSAFQRRPKAGGSSRRAAGVNVAPPEWVRLVRRGNTVSAYTSPNGASWSPIGSDTIQLGATAYVGLAVSSHDASTATTAILSQVSVTRLGLPAGQQAADIGSPAIAGSTSYANGTYQIHAGGADIWGTSDQFHFVYQQASGDLDLRLRVDSITLSASWAKAGVMIRESLTAGSSHAYAVLSADQGFAFHRRPVANDMTMTTPGSMRLAPAWVRLTRSGPLFTAYESVDGQNWTPIASESITMADTVYVGIAVTSQNPTTATDVVAGAFTITETGPENQPPTVNISSPANNATFTAPASITMTANAADPENQLTRVEFYNGTTLLGTDTAEPYAFTWPSVPAGTYSLTARAYDAGGLNTSSAAVSITVTAAANQPPTVSITSPANNATFTAPASITMTANATDPENQLTKVEFHNGTTLLGTDTAAPYSFTWSSVPSGTYSLTAVAYDAGGLNTRSAAVNVTVSGANQLPPGQQAADIGSPAMAGSTSYANGMYQIHAGGTDIWGTSDQFRFVYQQASGDLDLRLRVNSITLSASWAKAGVMIRETLTAGSNHAYAVLSANQGFAFHRRPVANNMTVSTSGSMRMAPAWVRLTRSGTLFTAYESVDGQNWSPIASASITMANTVYVGIAVTSQNPTTATDVLADAFTVTETGSANQPPTVSLSSPANNATFTAPASITMTANAADPENQLTRVEFYNGTTLLGTDTAAPYSFTWSSVPAGTYSLTARAYDGGGLNTPSAAVSVTVNGANQPPTVSITSPANNATFTAPASITMTANAADPENQLTRVEFYNGTTLLGTDTAAPYSFTWSSVPAGTYSLTARAYDGGGLNTPSAAVSVTVNGANQPPTVSITSPANNATFTAPASITMTANATDPENQLVKVEFYNGTTLLGTDTTAPYTFSWSSVPAGTYSLRAVAYDAGGLTAQSVAVTVTVGAVVQPPTGVIFQASVDHAVVVSYQVDVFAASADPATATPIATINVGKPAPDASNDITVSLSAFFSALAPGTYQLTVASMNAEGMSRSAPAVTFVR